ncbi:DUF1294 domain-containing protein [Flavobacterium sp. ACAM 123]|jgi:uncharacterized membrane protein YsdA (DUF1294 family)|uniref:DUF1294 domain-containing protein n=1 Tax=Flavobacterium sp. ACAM 123 TaxID=1189620 RepID=UPI000374A9B0|nr:DUF1294 domain-containing protein [Flavobacterium sp. ACAM 123]
MVILFYYFLIVNLIAFILIGYDKYLAKNHKSRISEKTLLAFVSIGGTIGSGFAMLVFRHKISKRSYILKFWFLIVIQILLFYFLYHYNLIEKITL